MTLIYKILKCESNMPFVLHYAVLVHIEAVCLSLVGSHVHIEAVCLSLLGSHDQVCISKRLKPKDIYSLKVERSNFD